MSEQRKFPVLISYRQEREFARRGIDCPHSVPWEFVAVHRKQCVHNHGHTLEQLAVRGGLGPAEMLCVVCDQHWSNADTIHPNVEGADELALPLLLHLVKQWEQERGER